MVANTSPRVMQGTQRSSPSPSRSSSTSAQSPTCATSCVLSSAASAATHAYTVSNTHYRSVTLKNHTSDFLQKNKKPHHQHQVVGRRCNGSHLDGFTPALSHPYHPRGPVHFAVVLTAVHHPHHVLTLHIIPSVPTSSHSHCMTPAHTRADTLSRHLTFTRPLTFDINLYCAVTVGT